MDQFFKPSDLGVIGPELELALFGMIVLVFDLLVKNKRTLGYIALGGIAWSGVFLFRLYQVVEAPAYGGVITLDPFAWSSAMPIVSSAASSRFSSTSGTIGAVAPSLQAAAPRPIIRAAVKVNATFRLIVPPCESKYDAVGGCLPSRRR